MPQRKARDGLAAFWWVSILLRVLKESLEEHIGLHCIIHWIKAFNTLTSSLTLK